MLLCFLLSNCTSSYKKVRGAWIIHKIELDDTEIPVNDVLSFNVIYLYKNKDCLLPLMLGETDNEETTYSVDNRADSILLNIETQNPMFDSVFTVEYIKEQKRKIDMIIKSDDYTIWCSKMTDVALPK